MSPGDAATHNTHTHTQNGKETQPATAHERYRRLDKEEADTEIGVQEGGDDMWCGGRIQTEDAADIMRAGYASPSDHRLG